MHYGVQGATGYKVGDHVRRPVVRLQHEMTVNLSAGTIDHVVSGVGGRPT
jgi:hypothetical protein